MKSSYATEFKFTAMPVKVLAMSVRESGKGEQTEPVVDLKLEATGLPVSCLAAILTTPVEAVRASFWDQDQSDKIDPDKGDALPVLFAGMRAIKTDTKYRKRHSLKVGQLDPVRLELVDKFENRPQPGETVDVTFRVVVSDPTPEWLAGAAHAVNNTMVTTLDQTPDLPMGDPSDGEQAPKRGRGRPRKDSGQTAQDGQEGVQSSRPDEGQPRDDNGPDSGEGSGVRTEPGDMSGLDDFDGELARAAQGLNDGQRAAA